VIDALVQYPDLGIQQVLSDAKAIHDRGADISQTIFEDAEMLIGNPVYNVRRRLVGVIIGFSCRVPLTSHVADEMRFVPVANVLTNDTWDIETTFSAEDCVPISKMRAYLEDALRERAEENA